MDPTRRIPAPRDPPQKISDEFWSAVEPLIPAKARAEGHAYRRQPGAGRKPIPPRQAFEAVVYVLRTGTPWKALPKSFGSASAIHRHFDAWHIGGLFSKLWRSGLAGHDEMEGIAWQWQKSPEGAAQDDPAPVPTSGTLVSPSKFSHQANGIVARDWQPSLARRRRRKSASAQ